MHWPTFWTAIEALATAGTLLIALVILFRELPKFRKEAAARKVEGLRYAREQLEAQDFHDWSEIIVDFWKTGGDEYPEAIEGYLVYALSRLDFVAKLIELDYVDEDLLFYLVADNLWPIERALTNFGSRKHSRIPNLRASFPGGYALLKEASKASSEERRKALERLREP
jgi:hypothetical protein